MALKKIVSITLCVCMLLLVLTGCNLFGGGKDNPSDPASTNGGTQGGNNNGGDDYVLTDPFWINYDWGKFNIADFVEPLGNATFTADNGNSAKGEYIPGEPFTLSLTDSAGTKWTLNIPANALFENTTITMTALRDVKIDGEADFNGVLMEPDGLTFSNAATLTVSGGNYSKDNAMYESNHDGTGVMPLYFENDANSATANVYHFSSKLKGKYIPEKKPTKLDWIVAASYSMCRWSPDVPEPPSLSFKCQPNHANNPNEKAALKEFLEDFLEPEWTLYSVILALSRGIDLESLATKKIENFTEDEIAYIGAMGRVLDRLDNKLVSLIGKYKGQEDKWKAIAHVSLWAGQTEKTILNIYLKLQTHEQNANRELEHDVSGWAKEVWNNLMKELVEKHDYTAAHALENVYLYAKILKVNDLDSYKEKLGNALTFRVEWELYDDEMIFTVNASGETVVSMNQISEKEGYWGEDTGEGRIDNAKMGTVKGVNLPTFSCSARLSNLDPCIRKKITVGVGGFGEGKEFTMDWGELGTSEDELGIAPELEAKLVDGFYTFEFTIANLQEKCVDEKMTYRANIQGFAFLNELTIRLIHAPKEDVFMR